MGRRLPYFILPDGSFVEFVFKANSRLVKRFADCCTAKPTDLVELRSILGKTDNVEKEVN